MGVENNEEYKKRILFVGEASFLNTGFSTYYRELLPRLVNTGKYEIAEFGSYASSNDPKVKEFIADRWKFYGNNPETDEERQFFNQGDPAQPGQNTNQFGKWKFEHVLADFKPDVVVDIRDWWMVAYQERSPFRKYFKWLVMPTVDSIPQKEEWIHTYCGANYVMAYSDFGIDSLRKSSPKLELRMDPPNKKGFIGVDKMPGRLHPTPLRPGVDLKTFFPRTEEEKADLKQKWGIKPDIPIVVLVQRNQSRKRISEVLRAWALMKKTYSHEAVQKAILVMHTAWPDNAMSIDFPRAIARIATGYHGVPVKHKNIMQEVCSTFMCENPDCRDVFIAPSINMVHHPVITCAKCGQRSAKTPSTGNGITREQLSEVYGMADMMVQMSIAEGCGMPVQEAKACGVPTLVTDYAALSEKGRVPKEYDHIDHKNYTVQKGGVTMELAYLYEEPETTCWRAMTSIEDCAEKMAKILSSKEYHDKLSQEARQCVEDNYDWDKNYKEWEFILDHITPLDRDQTWDKPIELIEIDQTTPPDGLGNIGFVEWCYINILKYSSSDQIDDQGMANWMQKLEHEAQNGVPPEQTRAQILEYFKARAEALNYEEMLRAGKLGEQDNQKDDNSDSFQAVIV